MIRRVIEIDRENAMDAACVPEPAMKVPLEW